MIKFPDNTIKFNPLPGEAWMARKSRPTKRKMAIAGVDRDLARARQERRAALLHLDGARHLRGEARHGCAARERGALPAHLRAGGLRGRAHRHGPSLYPG